MVVQVLVTRETPSLNQRRPFLLGQGVGKKSCDCDLVLLVVSSICEEQEEHPRGVQGTTTLVEVVLEEKERVMNHLQWGNIFWEAGEVGSCRYPLVTRLV